MRRYRLAAGLTQEELAERAGLSARGISDLERGLSTRARKETLNLLAVDGPSNARKGDAESAAGTGGGCWFIVGPPADRFALL